MARLLQIAHEILNGARVGLTWGAMATPRNSLTGRVLRVLVVWL